MRRDGPNDYTPSVERLRETAAFLWDTEAEIGSMLLVEGPITFVFRVHLFVFQGETWRAIEAWDRRKIDHPAHPRPWQTFMEPYAKRETAAHEAYAVEHTKTALRFLYPERVRPPKTEPGNETLAT